MARIKIICTNCGTKKFKVSKDVKNKDIKLGLVNIDLNSYIFTCVKCGCVKIEFDIKER